MSKVKLTPAQIDMLRSSARRPQRVCRGYKPAQKLSALGFVEIAIEDGTFPWLVEATDLGRSALAEEGGGR